MIIALVLIVVLWLAYEIWRAPLYDHNNNIVQPPKKLRDLFKKK